MKIEHKETRPAAGGAASVSPQIQVRSGLRSGAADGCELGVNYWRKEYNNWKKMAQQLGCA